MKQKQIEIIKELHNKGKKQQEIAAIIGVSQKTICYWLKSKEERNLMIKKQIDIFRNKTKLQKTEIYKKRLPYLKKYQKNRYNKDEEFRKKKIECSRKYYKSMKGGKIKE